MDADRTALDLLNFLNAAVLQASSPLMPLDTRTTTVQVMGLIAQVAVSRIKALEALPETDPVMPTLKETLRSIETLLMDR